MGKNKGGRPSKYTRKLGDEICRRLAEGESLITMCEEAKMPDRGTVLSWALGQVKKPTEDGFPHKYAHAREVQAEAFIDEAIPISDAVEGEQSSASVQAAKLRVDTRKWYATKLLPRFADHKSVELTGKGGGPIETKSTSIPLEDLSPETLRIIKKELEEKGGGDESE